MKLITTKYICVTVAIELDFFSSLYFLLQMHEYTWTIQTYTINVTGFAWKLTKAKKYKLEYEQTIYAL